MGQGPSSTRSIDDLSSYFPPRENGAVGPRWGGPAEHQTSQSWELNSKIDGSKNPAALVTRNRALLSLRPTLAQGVMRAWGTRKLLVLG
jgi:hypothetical protein